MDEYTPCKKPDPTAREAIGNVMRLVRVQSRKKNKYNARKTVMCGRQQAGGRLLLGASGTQTGGRDRAHRLPTVLYAP